MAVAVAVISGRSQGESAGTGSSQNAFSSQTVNCLSGLLNRIRHGNGRDSSQRKQKIIKEHRAQVRWSHYDKSKKKFTPMSQKNGGGNWFIACTDADRLKLEDLMEKASALFFLEGKNSFVSHLNEMNKWISSLNCDTTGVDIFDFPDKGTVDENPKKNYCLYASSTSFYFRTQPQYLFGDEFECSSDEATGI